MGWNISARVSFTDDAAHNEGQGNNEETGNDKPQKWLAPMVRIESGFSAQKQVKGEAHKWQKKQQKRFNDGSDHAVKSLS